MPTYINALRETFRRQLENYYVLKVATLLSSATVFGCTGYYWHSEYKKLVEDAPEKMSYFFLSSILYSIFGVHVVLFIIMHYLIFKRAKARYTRVQEERWATRNPVRTQVAPGCELIAPNVGDLFVIESSDEGSPSSSESSPRDGSHLSAAYRPLRPVTRQPRRSSSTREAALPNQASTPSCIRHIRRSMRIQEINTPRPRRSRRNIGQDPNAALHM